MLISGGTSAPETLLLIGAPGADGVVHVRSWSGTDWSAPPRVRAERASDLLARLEAEAAAGRRMNQSLHALRLWLRSEGGAPR